MSNRSNSERPEHDTVTSLETDLDSAVSAFEASSATLLKVCRVDPKPGGLRADRNFRLVVH